MSHRALRRAAVAFALGTCLVATDRPVFAHQPSGFDAQRSVTLEDPAVSYALYGEIKDGGDDFEIALPLEVLVPRRDELAEHRPIFAIVGPGLPPPTEPERALLPRAVPAGMGVIVGSAGPDYRESIFESFTRRVFWTNGVTAYVIPAGDVQIWVWAPRRTTGKFVIGIGVEEAGIDMGNVLENWGTYAY
jgi:hypothetical protein